MNIKKKNLYRQFLFLLGLLFSLNVMAQSVTVTGTVRDAAGDPMPGVNVQLKGTTQGVATDIDGRYSVPNVSRDAVLIFSFVGFHTQEIAISGRARIDVTMTEDTRILDEVVVIGYGQVRKGDATGAIASVKADEEMRGFAPNAQDMLVGKVAGVNITTAGGSPSAEATIRIRGGSSLSASNDPLLIIDGVPVDNGGIGGVGNLISAINPSDIETFSVLKDASATAIYGSRASNGVIIITTKKGTEGKLKITYDGNVSVNFRTNEVEVLNGDEFREFVQNTFAGASNYDEVVGKLGAENTDWQDEIFETSYNTEHNLSLYGTAKEVMPYRASLGYTNINGILKTSNMERFTGSLSLSPEFFDKKLSVQLNAKGMYIDNRFANQGAIGSAVSMDPTKPVWDPNSPYGGYWSWTDGVGNISDVATKNPVSLLEMRKDESNVWNFIGNAQIDYKLHWLPELRFNLNVGMDYSKGNGSNYIPADAPSDFLYGGFDGNWEQTRRNSLLDFYTQYTKDLGFWGSKFDVMAGYSWQHYWREGNNHDYRISKLDGEGNPEVVSINSYETEYYLVSFFGRLNYSIADKYYATFTLRDDGSSRFHKDNRWGLFPSVALAWRISDENFLKDNGVLDNLKLRLGWGQTGQQDINAGDYPYMGRYELSVGQTSYLRGYDGSNARWISLIRPNSYNRDLKWETTTTYNAGLDFGFLSERINGSVDFYFRKTEDLINAETKVAAGTNFSEYVTANIGDLENKGVEFSVNALAIKKTDFAWEIGGNFAYNQNEIKTLSYGDVKNTIRRYGNTGGDGGFQLMVHSVGNPAGMFYVYEQIYDERGKPIEGMYVDRDNNGQITEEDLRPYKKPTPDWTFGLNTKWTWKAFDLSIAGHGSIGNYNYNAVAANSAELSRARVYANEFLGNRTRSAFDTEFAMKQVLSDYYVQDASFFRIDNVTLGWSFDNKKTIPLNGRVYCAVQNPIVFTKYDGLDPEVFGGVDTDFYPRPLTVMLGVNLNF